MLVAQFIFGFIDVYNEYLLTSLLIFDPNLYPLGVGVWTFSTAFSTSWTLFCAAAVLGSDPTTYGYEGGDLLGVVEHLDYLSNPGINALYLNPLFQSASNHRYHTHDEMKVDPLLGGDEAFDAFVVACNEGGIRVILDGSFNHAIQGFFCFNNVLENAAASPWFDWFIVKEARPNTYLQDKIAGYEIWWELHALLKLITDNPQMREYIMQVTEH